MNDEYLDKAEKYLAYQLSAEERTEVETQRKENAEFEKAFQMVLLSRNVINQGVEDDLRLKIRSWRNESNNKKSYFIYSAIGIAATLALIMTFYFLFIPAVPLDNLQLAKAMYTQPTQPEATMGSADSLLAAGFEAYSAGSYPKAISIWEQLAVPTPEVKYYMGHAYFQAGAYDKAATLFQELSLSNNIFAYPSDWYEVLSLLAADRTEKMIVLLDKILSDKDHPYYEDAEKLMQHFQNRN